tara:strand:- start:94 stop:462 length:369 start_codon:yes stop_codon:yes gene_type:complete
MKLLKYIIIIILGPIITTFFYFSGDSEQKLDYRWLILTAVLLFVPIIPSIIAFNKYKKFKKGFKFSIFFTWAAYLLLIIVYSLIDPEVLMWSIVIIIFGIPYTLPSVLSVCYGIGKIIELKK